MRILSNKGRIVKAKWDGDRVYGKFNQVMRVDDYGLYLSRSGKRKQNAIRRKRLMKAL